MTMTMMVIYICLLLFYVLSFCSSKDLLLHSLLGLANSLWLQSHPQKDQNVVRPLNPPQPPSQEVIGAQGISIVPDVSCRQAKQPAVFVVGCGLDSGRAVGCLWSCLWTKIVVCGNLGSPLGVFAGRRHPSFPHPERIPMKCTYIHILAQSDFREVQLQSDPLVRHIFAEAFDSPQLYVATYFPFGSSG